MIVEPQSVVQSSTVLENWIAEITTELSCDEGYAYRLLRSGAGTPGLVATARIC